MVIQGAGNIGEELRAGAAGTRNHVAHDIGVGRRAVGGFPEFGAVGGIGGGEEEHAADVGQVRRIRTGRGGGDVFNKHGTSGGAGALPQLGTVGGIGGGEIKGAANAGQVVWVGIGCPGGNVENQHGTGAATVALPQFGTVGAIIRCEVQSAAHVG